MQINIKYFAALKDDTGIRQETVETNASTIEELFNELNDKHQFSIAKKNLRAAKNEEYTDFSSTLTENDTIAFIPPVAGG
ncbi:MAG: molybdopterin converting factor subunit 1 [Bacteriovoracaceae bacterium]|jgi:molybdopterin converting factor subunit 1|nr:molybdopterin converting factor subunit 1 [Bacteriovoracaceae bacterium]